MKYWVTVGGRTLEVELAPEGVRIGARERDADLQRVPGTDVHSLLLDGRSYRVLVREGKGGRWVLHLDGRSLEVEVVDERTRAIREMTGQSAGAGGPRPVKAPMPGLVVKVEVAEGDEVGPGQGLVIVEAMKMENELRADAPARVRAVHVTPGDTVEKDQVLIEFESPETS